MTDTKPKIQEDQKTPNRKVSKTKQNHQVTSCSKVKKIQEVKDKDNATAVSFEKEGPSVMSERADGPQEHCAE